MSSPAPDRPETVAEWVARHMAAAPSWRDLSSAQRDQLQHTFGRSSSRLEREPAA
ncbi:hypothetical protein [Actinophytocola sediminis]